MNFFYKLFFCVFFYTILFSSFASEVNVYSYRKPQLVQPLFDAFLEKTNIKVNVIFAKKGLLERVKNEGKNSPVDLILTVDIGRLTDIKEAGLLQTVRTKELKKNIPHNFTDVDFLWYGLTSRARVVVVSKNSGINSISYEELALPRYKGKICTRSGKHPYMVALISSIIVEMGEKKAEKWLSRLKVNLARKPQGNDRAQVKAIHNGICEIAIINHYYMASMLKDKKQKEWANSVKVIFPNQNDRGVHMNVSGVGLAKYAPNKANAIRLMNFLSSDEGQEIYTQTNDEYPVNDAIEWSALQKSWGKFKKDKVHLSKVANNRSKAVKMVDRVSYNE